ncbi:hypothetical protein DOTSEDRAFT_74809 [Dothistroma septosporum NZE10]|uniref:AB hydrolase-1 domain-containing protein n=1 Tax=Dothistroma septosporum (strain NZE10 / CBS 128990) TaxID=675120 RepID=N1PC98_DOTSN|nr:hypothetical protein DOTSEDRAFT_74809 [Dothistroma septosporum NZE10]
MATEYKSVPQKDTESAPFLTEESDEQLGVNQPRQTSKDQARWTARRVRKYLLYALLIATLLGTFAALALIGYDWRHIAHSSAQQDTQNMSWSSCGDVSGRPLECANITVPMDHFDAANSKDKTFSIPLIRLRGAKDAKQYILLNPGGPGGSGMRLLYKRGSDFRQIIGDDFHLLGFDPRGVNTSTPQAICYPNHEAKGRLSTVHTAEAVHDSPEMYGWAKNFVQACSDTMGEHGAYLTTPQTAADMNSILDAIGQEDMYYWGFSYGTTLGQTYAQLYPERSKRLILDGVSNSFHWYGRDFDSVHYTDTGNAFRGFFSECVKANQDCPLYPFGDTPDRLYDIVMDLGASLKEQPISVYVNNTAWGLLTYEDIFFSGVLPALYRPAKWHALAENLAKLLKGDATDAWLAYAGQEAFAMGDDASEFIFNNDNRSGPKYWPQGRQEFLDEILPIINVSIFGPSENLDYYTKQQWVIPQTVAFTPKTSVHTAHPILLVSMTVDPICPLISAQTTQEVFEESRLLEIEGFGHCSLSVTSACAAKHIRAFFTNGTVPDEMHTKCQVDRPYFTSPDLDAKIITRRAFEAPEDEKIHRAQLSIARNWEWKVRRGGLPIPI